MAVAEVSPPKTSTAFQHILVATDFSEPSRRALCDALALAAEHHSRVSVVHILRADRQFAGLESPPELDLARIDAERQLRSLITQLGPDAQIDESVVKRGPVAEVVESLIEERAIDLLVIGTRGRGGLRMLALGSVAEELLRVASCPVMTIGPKADMATRTSGPGFHRILFATDYGKGSARALPLTLALAQSHQAKLILLHMIPPMPGNSGSLSAYAPAALAADEVLGWEGTSRKRALQQLREYLPAETGLEQEVEFVVGTDFLAEGVLTAAARYRADLIVMGANRTASPRVAAHIPWAAVHEVVRNAPCPVLTVRG